jgi:hypothetical protein
VEGIKIWLERLFLRYFPHKNRARKGSKIDDWEEEEKQVGQKLSFVLPTTQARRYSFKSSGNTV